MTDNLNPLTQAPEQASEQAQTVAEHTVQMGQQAAENMGQNNTVSGQIPQNGSSYAGGDNSAHSSNQTAQNGSPYGYPPYSANNAGGYNPAYPYTAPTQGYGAPQYGAPPYPPYAYVPVNQQQDSTRSSKNPPSKTRRIVTGVLAGIGIVTFLFVCTVCWVQGLRIMNQPKNDYQSGNNGGVVVPDFGGSGSGEDFPYSDFFDYFQIPEGGNGGTTIPSGSVGLGVTVTNSPELDIEIPGGYTGGAIITEIRDFSCFVGTEVEVNDMIVAIDDQAVTNINDLTSALQTMSVGDEVTIKLARYEVGVASVFDVTVKLVDISQG